MILPVGSFPLVGLLAAACTTSAFVPQVVRVWRLKRAEETSLATFLVLSIGSFVWLVYGLLIDSFPVVLANSGTLVLVGTILGLKLKGDRAAPPLVAEKA